jgi:DnaK suppressor protein
MTDAERAQLREKIRESIMQTERDIVDLTELTKPIEPENAIGRISRMDAINNKSVNEAALRQATAKLEKLRVALEKCDDVSFGTCTRCGASIQMGRLLFMPESALCMKCASR